MKKTGYSFPLFLLLLGLITVVYWAGVSSVPFHPDESTFLYMSADLETLFRSPLELAWRPDGADMERKDAGREDAGREDAEREDAGYEGALRRHYWLMDAPLGRYLVGLGRWAAGQPALPTDWNWSKTWQENAQAGALPSAELLAAGRMGAAVLFPFSVLLLFLAARRAAGDFCAWTAALLLAFNGLMWLHARRAMSEGALVFSACLSLWVLLKAERRPWLAALPLALGMAAKLSLAALAPVGLLAALWPVKGQEAASVNPTPGGSRAPLLPTNYLRPAFLRPALARAALFTALLLLALGALHPFLWRDPIRAISAAIVERETFVQGQLQYTTQTLDTPLWKTLGLIGGVYLTPPIFAEVGNYQAETRAAEEDYLANPLHSMLRSVPAGGLMMLFSLAGILAALRQVTSPAQSSRRALALLLAATLLQTLALFVLVPLPWQRYYMPLIPLACFWAAYGVDALRRAIRRPGVAKASAELLPGR